MLIKKLMITFEENEYGHKAHWDRSSKNVS